MEYKHFENTGNTKVPLVSVCVVTYNHSQYIRQCLDSILMQKTNFPFEIILGEDESTDGTREICIEYANKYPEIIRLFLRSRKDVIYINGNPTGRFNMIENIKAASGKYVALCEGDDYWTNQLKLQRQIDVLEENEKIAGSFHLTNAINMQGQIMGVYGNHESMTLATENTIAITSPFHTSSFVFRRKHFKLLDWFYKVVSLDMALFSIISDNGNFIGIAEVLSVYRKHFGGLTETTELKLNYHKNRVELMEYLNEFFHFKYSKEIGEVIAFHRARLTTGPHLKKKRPIIWRFKNFLEKTWIKFSVSRPIKFF